MAPTYPQIMKPLPQFALEMTMTIQKIPNLTQLLYGEREEDAEEVDGAMTEVIPLAPIVNMNDFFQVKGEEKLNLLMVAIDKINTTFQYKINRYSVFLIDEEDGVFLRLRDCEREVDDQHFRMDKLEETNKSLVSDVEMLKGIIQVQQNKISSLQKQVVDLRKRSMKNNVVID